jgi:hypothetical protein
MRYAASRTAKALMITSKGYLEGKMIRAVKYLKKNLIPWQPMTNTLGENEKYWLVAMGLDSQWAARTAFVEMKIDEMVTG